MHGAGGQCTAVGEHCTVVGEHGTAVGGKWMAVGGQCAVVGGYGEQSQKFEMYTPSKVSSSLHADTLFKAQEGNSKFVST